jgi:hypothetical protein
MPTLEQIKKDVGGLAPEERAELLDWLVQSAADIGHSEEFWRIVQLRWQGVVDGTRETIPSEEVHRRVRERLASIRSEGDARRVSIG